MILSRKYLKTLVRAGKAKIEGLCGHPQKLYVIVTRLDKRRTDHYLAIDADVRITA